VTTARRLLTAVWAAALLLAGCSAAADSAAPASSAAPTSAPTSPPPLAAAPSTAGTPAPDVPGIAAEAVRLRTDEAIGGQVQVRVTDTGDAPFTVTAVALDSPGFTPLPARPQAAAFEPGRVIDLPTPFGDPVCAVAAQPAAALLAVTRPDGAVEQLRVPLAADTLDLVHGELCAVEAVEAVVDIRVVDLGDVPQGATGTVQLSRTGVDDRPVSVDRLGRSVLVAADAQLPVELAAGEADLRVPVTFTPASCDPHVLAETKKPFVFPLDVSVGGTAEVPVDLPLDDAQKGQLAAMVERVCGR
jgi:hypothetical protein